MRDVRARYAGQMLIDAIVLSGGRSSRLGGTPKAAFVVGGRTLLQLAIAASMSASARRIAVVGDVDALPIAERLDDRVLVTREDPPFGGPAAGIAAGTALLAALEPQPSDVTLVLACDVPGVGAATAALVTAVRAGMDGVIAIDEGQHPQPLLAIYDTARLREAIDERIVDGISVRDLISGLLLERIPMPNASTRDVDTWADAAEFGIPRPAGQPPRRDSDE